MNYNVPLYFTIIFIANREEDIFGRVNDPLVNRFRASKPVYMEQYHGQQLFDTSRLRRPTGSSKRAKPTRN